MITEQVEDGPKELVLVIDDNVQNRAVAEGQLLSAGYAVITAENGELGLDLFQKQQPDLVLLDILMPGIDGIETCRRMRKLEGGDETPIVFITAHGDLDTQREALGSGADDFLTKPIQRTELLLRVRSLLRIKRISRALKRRNAELLKVQRQKDELSALIVHDLKNPLAAILTNGTFLLDLSNLADGTKPVVRDMISAAESMKRMVMNLLDLSRSEDGALALSVEAVEPAQLIADAARAMEGRASERDHHLRVELDADLPQFQCDYELLKRVLENLLDNSFKYTPRRGEIILACRRAGEAALEFLVVDQGPGIPEAFRGRVFEKYVQLESEARQHGRMSRGLGLAYCKVAVEAHGGSMNVDNVEPRGACFRAIVPLAPPPPGLRLVR